jgi:hypothetical protein
VSRTRPDAATRAILTDRAEALDAEHARLTAELNDLHAKVGAAQRARHAAWDAVDGIAQGPRREPTMREMMALHDHD